MITISPTPALDPDLMTDAEKEERIQSIRDKNAAFEKILSEECIGKYKIELLFSYRRTCSKLNIGMLSIWESGSKLGGGGDGKVYICPGKEKGVNNCIAPIPFDNCNYGHLLCPTCKKLWKSSEVFGEFMAKLSVQEWAEKLVYYYVLLGNNADVYIKQPRQDIRAAAKKEQDRVCRGDILMPARMGMVKSYYPLARIIKDTGNGASLYNRFLAFLKS